MFFPVTGITSGFCYTKGNFNFNIMPKNKPVSAWSEKIWKLKTGDFRVSVALNENMIITTQDKIELCLTKYLRTMERKKEWFTPAGILTTLVISCLTTDFRDWVFSAHTWRVIFIVLGVISLIWLIVSVYYSFSSKTVHDVLEHIKKGEPRTKKQVKRL